MKKTAKCHYGKVTAETTGEPDTGFICYCTDCQRKTGSSYQIGAWFSQEDTKFSGETKEFKREDTDQGANVIFRFCPNCDTSILNTCEELIPCMIGVAVGCFEDPKFPEPTISIYGRSRHEWLTPPTGMPRFVERPGSELEPALEG